MNTVAMMVGMLSRQVTAMNAASGRCTGSGMKHDRKPGRKCGGDAAAMQRPQMRIGELGAEMPAGTTCRGVRGRVARVS